MAGCKPRIGPVKSCKWYDWFSLRNCWLESRSCQVLNPSRLDVLGWRKGHNTGANWGPCRTPYIWAWFNWDWDMGMSLQWIKCLSVTYLNQCWPDSLMHICGTRGRWVKPCRPLEIDVSIREKPGLPVMWNRVVPSAITMIESPALHGAFPPAHLKSCHDNEHNDLF